MKKRVKITPIPKPTKAKTGGFLRLLTGKGGANNSDCVKVHLQPHHVAAMRQIEAWAQKAKPNFAEAIGIFTNSLTKGTTKAQQKELIELRSALDKSDGVEVKATTAQLGAIVASFFRDLHTPILSSEFIEELEKAASGRDQSKFIIQLEKLDEGQRGVMRNLALLVYNVDGSVCGGTSRFREAFFGSIYQKLVSMPSMTPGRRDDAITRGSAFLSHAIEFLPLFMLFSGRLQGKLPPMPGEFVLRGYDGIVCVNRDIALVESAFSGELWLTNHRLIFRYPPRTTPPEPDAEPVVIPLRSIVAIDRDSPERIRIVMGTYTVYYIAFHDSIADNAGRALRDICAALEEDQINPYALNNTELPAGDPLMTGLATREMARLGLPEQMFRVSDANKDYSIAVTYPQQFIMPRAIEDGVIHRQGLEFGKRRFPYIAWYNVAGGVGLYRSFPLTDLNEGNKLFTALTACNRGAIQIFDTAGEEWVRQHRRGTINPTALSLPSPAQIREAFFDLIDTEFAIGEDSALELATAAALEEVKKGDIQAALAIISGRRDASTTSLSTTSTTASSTNTNGSDGTGSSGDGTNSSASLSQSSLDNGGSKDSRDGNGEGSHGALASTDSGSSNSSSDAAGNGNNTVIGDGTTTVANQLPKPKWRDFRPFNIEWNRQVGRTVDAAATVVTAMSRGSVLLEHGNNDWCGTDCAVSSIAQLALDPYYRTIEGFAVLVTKEWILSGFPFSLRSFLGDPNEPSGYAPVFLLFLNAAYRVYATFSSRFEFTDELLIFIADSLYSGRFGTFISNTAAEAEYLSKNTVSIWTYIREHREDFINPFFYPEENEAKPLDLQQCSRHTTWNYLYLRYHPVGKFIYRRLWQSVMQFASKTSLVRKINQSNMDLFYVPKQIYQFDSVVILNLTGNHLVSLSPEVGKLKNLRELVLTENEFTSIPGSTFTILSKLPGLEIIDLNKNSLSTLPEEISRLESLKALNLSENAFVVFPPALMRVKGLVTLDVSYNRIELISPNDSAPDEAEQRLRIQQRLGGKNSILPVSIRASNNIDGNDDDDNGNTGREQTEEEIASGCPSFFDSLVILRLDHNRLVGFPEAFTHLRKLQRLDLSYNYLERFPTHFYRLQELRKLNASHNKLTQLSPSATTLFRLEELNLEFNNLTSLPTSIGRLSKLRVLNVNDNKLTAIPSRIGQLFLLEVLNITHNNITALKDTMYMFTRMMDFFCDGAPRITYPSADLLSANYSVMAEAFREGMAARVTTHRVKLIIVGSENVGKTSLLRSLKRRRTMGVVGGGASKTDIQFNVSTDGVKIEDWPFSMEFDEFDEATGKVVRVRKHDITVSAWDFAGQQIYGTTHQFFLSSKAVYLAVWDMQQPIDESSMYNWLWTIRMYAPRAPIIIVGTHKDKIQGGTSAAKRIISDAIDRYGTTFAQGKISVSDIVSFSNDSGDSGVAMNNSNINNVEFPLTGYAVSCINDEGVNKLRHGLETTFNRYPFTRQNITKAFLVLEKLILEEREGNLQPVLSWIEFCTLAAVCSLSTQDLVCRAAEYLNQLGTIVYFPQDPELKDLVVIDPQWLSDLFTTLVTTKPNYVPPATGILNTKNLLHLWLPPKFPPDMHSKLLTLLERFEIVFNISLRKSKDLHNDPIDILVPSVLPEHDPIAAISSTWPQLRPNGTVRQVSRTICFGQIIPPGFFLRLLVRILRALQTAPTHIWRHGLIIKSHPKAVSTMKGSADTFDTVLYVREANNGTINVVIRGNEGALPEVCAFARTVFDAATSFISDDFKDKTVISVPCIHCILNSVQAPKMFVINECENAVIRGDKEIKCGNGHIVPLDFLVPELGLNSLTAPKADMSEITMGQAIGQGATAIVNKGTYKGQVVAVKKLIIDEVNESTRCGSQAFTEFRREAHVMCMCKHPCILGLTAVCLRPLCLLTEFIPYGNLFDLVNDKSRPLELPMVIKIAHDVASGMAYLHDMDPPLLHRDLKSPNVFINGRSPLDLVVAKVADFGVTGNAYAVGQNVDNPIWLAPEVMQRQEPTTTSDVYSFGVILWELVSRSQFFSEISFMTVLESKVIAGERPQIPSSCPPAYQKLIQLCWANKPEARPSFKEIVKILEELVHDPALELEDRLTLCVQRTTMTTALESLEDVQINVDDDDDDGYQIVGSFQQSLKSPPLPHSYQDSPRNLYTQQPQIKSPLQQSLLVTLNKQQEPSSLRSPQQQLLQPPQQQLSPQQQPLQQSSPKIKPHPQLKIPPQNLSPQQQQHSPLNDQQASPQMKSLSQPHIQSLLQQHLSPQQQQLSSPPIKPHPQLKIPPSQNLSSSQPSLHQMSSSQPSLPQVSSPQQQQQQTSPQVYSPQQLYTLKSSTSLSSSPQQQQQQQQQSPQLQQPQISSPIIRPHPQLKMSHQQPSPQITPQIQSPPQQSQQQLSSPRPQLPQRSQQQLFSPQIIPSQLSSPQTMPQVQSPTQQVQKPPIPQRSSSQQSPLQQSQPSPRIKPHPQLKVSQQPPQLQQSSPQHPLVYPKHQQHHQQEQEQEQQQLNGIDIKINEMSSSEPSSFSAGSPPAYSLYTNTVNPSGTSSSKLSDSDEAYEISTSSTSTYNSVQGQAQLRAQVPSPAQGKYNAVNTSSSTSTLSASLPSSITVATRGGQSNNPTQKWDWGSVHPKYSLRQNGSGGFGSQRPKALHSHMDDNKKRNFFTMRTGTNPSGFETGSTTTTVKTQDDMELRNHGLNSNSFGSLPPPLPSRNKTNEQQQTNNHVSNNDDDVIPPVFIQKSSNF